MRRIWAVILAGVFFACGMAHAAKTEGIQVSNKDLFYIYSDKGAPGNHYIPSGYMGDYNDVRLNEEYTENVKEGKTCIQVIYTADKSQKKGWVGVYWQNPANNWGTKQGGYDLSAMNKLTFWARGEYGDEIIAKFIVGGIKGSYADTTEVDFGPVQLSDEWQQYTINLVGKDLSYISGGFAFILQAGQNPDGCTFYLDDIKLEYDPDLKANLKGAEPMPFAVYTDKRSVNNHYVPSGYMGDWGDIKMDEASEENPHSGDTCIRFEYTAKASQGARWAGVYWLNPANNWGLLDGGYDLSKAKKLTFWARGEKGGERIEQFKVGGVQGKYSDSDAADIGPIVLTTEWKQYTIDLSGKDMSYIIGGFCWVTNADVNPEGAVFYLDDVVFEE